MKARGAAGFTLVEVLLAAMVLLVAVVGLGTALARGGQARQETMVSEAAARAIIDRLDLCRCLLPIDIVAQAAAEASFTPIPAALRIVGGPYAGLPAGSERRVEVLSEASASAEFGLALDLDLDGTAGEDDATSTRADYLTVPVRVTVRWPMPEGRWGTMQALTMVYPSRAND